MLKPIWRSTAFNIHTKIKIFNSNVLCVLLYGSEFWKPSLLNRSDVSNMIPINSGMNQDAMAFLTFLYSLNGCCQFPDQLWSLENDLKFFTVSTKLTGDGVYVHRERTYIPWPSHWYFNTRHEYFI